MGATSRSRGISRWRFHFPKGIARFQILKEIKTRTSLLQDDFQMRLLVQLEPPVGVADIGRTLILTDSSSLIIGRCKSAADALSTNLLFNCRVVSRNHGILFVKDGNVFVQDTKSSSGTFVNGFRLSPPGIQSTPYQISEGDELRLGEDIKVSGVAYKAVTTTVHISEAPPNTSQDQPTKPHPLFIPESSKSPSPLSPALTLTATRQSRPRQETTSVAGSESTRRTDLQHKEEDLDALVEKELDEIWTDLKPNEICNSFDRLRIALSFATTQQKQKATYVAVSLASEPAQVPRGLESISTPTKSQKQTQSVTNVQPNTS